jgi:hypothetical protein
MWVNIELPCGEGSNFLKSSKLDLPNYLFFWCSQSEWLWWFFCLLLIYHLCRRVEFLFLLESELLSCPLMVNLMDPFPISMCALAVLNKGLSRMSDTFESGCISSTTKSTSTEKSLILTRIFMAMPNGYQTDWSASWTHIDVSSSAVWLSL